tara:strand:- start:8103 stop:9434 length:1332 start_codon:yes stop_codon:yes gene_type:complete
MQFEFAAPSGRDTDNRTANTARLLNMYRESAGDGSIWCRSMPGMTQFATTAKVFCRAMAEVDDEIYVAQGGTLFQITSGGSAVTLGAIVDDVETSISGNNGNVTVVAGGVYYVWDGATLTQPTGGAFSTFGDVTFFAQLTILTEDGGRRVQWSGLADPTSLGALDFATTEARDDKILRVMPVGSALWFLKDTSIEPWYSTGTGVAATPGATIERGLKSRNLAVQIPGGAFFVGDDNNVYIGNMGGLQDISITAVSVAIADGTPERVFYFESLGNKFCALIFGDRPAWVYNTLSGEWCERAQGVLLGAWDAKACVKALGTWYVGTDSGPVATLGRTNQDFGATMIRRIISRTIEQDGKRFTIPQVQVRTKVGVFDAAPELGMRMSNTFGLTWQVDRTDAPQTLGELGEYLNRTIFRRLGSYRQATMELTLSTTDDVTISSVAYV